MHFQVEVCTVFVVILNPSISGGTWSVEPGGENDSCSRYCQKGPSSKRSVPSLLGGVEEVDTNDAMTQQAAQWSVGHMNKMSNSLFTQALQRVIHATRQVRKYK